MSDAAEDAPEVGPLADEAAKLFGALAGWARQQAGESGDGFAGVAARAAESAHEVSGHLATGSDECSVCPICRTVHAVRQLNPDVKAHLVSAATSLAQAAASLMATRLPDEGAPASGVECCDLGDEGPEDE